MSVVVANEVVGPCRRKLTIEIPAEAVDAEIGRVVGEYRRRIEIPGFRKGKVPVSLVRKRYREEIEYEVAQRLVPRYWHQAQAEQNLDPLLPPQFEEPSFEAGEPMTLVASVETRPEIELGALDDFRLPEESTEPTDEEVERALADLARQHAAWVAVERGAARGDLVIAGLTALDGEGAGEERPLHVELGGEGVPEELGLALTDLAAGQKTDFEGPLGDQPARKYSIEVREVREQELPEIDEAFAAKLGEFESVDELRTAVAGQLRQQKELDLRRRREQALLEQMRSRHPLELPAGVVQQQSEEIVQRTADQMAQRGLDVKNADVDWASMISEVRPEAERQVHNRLLLDAVAESEGLRLDEQKFEQLLSSLATQQGMPTLALRARLSETGRLEPLRAQLLREQAVRHLLADRDESADQDESTDQDMPADEESAAGEPDPEDRS